jgi:rhomboid-like protein
MDSEAPLASNGVEYGSGREIEHGESFARGRGIRLTVKQADRLLPSLALTLLVLGLSYAFAANYEAPARADRMWPDMPPAAATAFAIMGANLAIFLLWKFPPAWRTLNRYFINVAFKPHPLSIVGNVFSHQQFKHLAMNMLMLWFIGTKRECR